MARVLLDGRRIPPSTMIFKLLPLGLPHVATTLLAAACLAFPGSSFAKDDVVIDLSAQKVSRSGTGPEKLVAADEVKPGDVLEYRAVYRNVSAQSVASLQATLPIPTGVEVLLESARPPAPQASLDGQTFAATPLTRAAKDAAGKPITEPVPTREIRALRWLAPQLAAGGKFTVATRVRVLTTPPPSKPGTTPNP